MQDRVGGAKIHFHHLKKTIHRKTLDYRKRCILYIEKIGRVFIKNAQKKDLVISIISSWLVGWLDSGWLDGWRTVETNDFYY